MENVLRMKISLLGDGGVGKTTLLHREMSGEFKQKYIPTIGCEVYSIKFKTNHGLIICDVWDTAGQEKFSCLRNAYYTNSDAAILMFDVGSRISFKNVPNFKRDFSKMCPNAPIILVGNKVDILDRKVMPPNIKHSAKNWNMKYFDVSAKSCYQWDRPFFEAMKNHFNIPDLKRTC
jgi:GTP-binding nuclear protein Ran